MTRINPFSRKLLIIYFYIILIVVGFNILKYNSSNGVRIFFFLPKDTSSEYYNIDPKHHHNDNIYNVDNDVQEQNNIFEGENEMFIDQVPRGEPSNILYFKFHGKYDGPIDLSEVRKCKGIDDRWYYLVRKPIYSDQLVDMDVHNDYQSQFQPLDHDFNKSIPRALISIEPPQFRYCTFNSSCFSKFNFKISYEAQSDVRIGFDTADISAFKLYNSTSLQSLTQIKNQFKKDYLTMKNTNRSALRPHQTSFPLVNWFCSNCFGVQSNREEYVKELMKHIVVDSYGRCLGNMETEKELQRLSDDPFENKKKVLSKYKFTIVFENSICKDYVSEKILDTFIAGSVPIYMGHPNTLKYLPYNSYIYVGDFNSAKELADYLKYLDANDLEYNKILHDWKTNETAIEQWKGVNNYPYKTGFRFREIQCPMLRLFQSLKAGKAPLKYLKYVPFDQICLPSDYFKI
ncbi:hypothetical protein ACTFIV_003902 [Dictyostelium citrinum]